MILRQRYIILIVFALIALPILSKAQYNRAFKYDFYYGIGASNIMGDIAAPPDANKAIWVNFFNTIGLVGNVGLKYNIEDRHYARASLFMGQFFSNEPVGDYNTWQLGRKANSFFTEVSAIYEFEIFKDRPKRTVYRQLGETKLKNFNLPTYVFVGVGGTFNAGKYTSLTNGGKGFESSPFVNLAAVFPVGIGFKIRLNRLTHLNLEAGYRYTLSDGIDKWRGEVEANGQFGTYIDQYQFVTFNVIHKLRANRKGFPIFRK